MKTSIVMLLLVLSFLPLWAESSSPADQAMEVVNTYHGSFSREDAEWRASLFAENAVWFNAFGARREGRETILQMWRDLFSRGIFDDASIEILGTSVYELSPSLVVVDQVERLEGQRSRTNSEDLELRFVHLTFIVEQHEGQWLITYYRASDLHRPPQWTPVIQAQQTDLVIAGVTLIDGSGEPPREGVTILVQDGLVADIVPAEEAVIPAGTMVIDASGKYVIPGLADMHVHFGRGGGLPNTPEATERVLRQFLFYGVTSVLNLGAYYGRADQILELRQRREAGEILAPHIYATGGLLTVPGSHPINSWARRMPESVDVESYDWSERGVWVVRTPEEVREVVRPMAAAGMDGIKVVIESEVLLPPYDEESPQMPLEMVRAAVEEAHQHELPVLAHISDPDELEAALDAGVDAVVHFGGEPPGPELLPRMEQQRMYLVPTLSAYIFADAWGDPADNLTDPFLRRGADEQVIESVLASPMNPTSAVTEEDWAWRRDYLAALKATHDAGVMLVGGSDPPAGLIFHGYNMHHELELMVEAGLTPMEALVAATSRAAEMIGEGDVFGTIEPGKRADMLILEADPLQEIRNTRTLETVILDGKVIDRSSPFPDE